MTRGRSVGCVSPSTPSPNIAPKVYRGLLPVQPLKPRKPQPQGSRTRAPLPYAAHDFTPKQETSTTSNRTSFTLTFFRTNTRTDSGQPMSSCTGTQAVDLEPLTPSCLKPNG